MNRETLRTGKIEIDLLKPEGKQWIVATIQRSHVDQEGAVISQSMNDQKVYRRVDNVVTQTVQITDPVTGLTTVLSVAAVSLAIKELMLRWIVEDIPDCAYNGMLDAVVVNDTDS